MALPVYIQFKVKDKTIAGPVKAHDLSGLWTGNEFNTGIDGENIRGNYSDEYRYKNRPVKVVMDNGGYLPLFYRMMMYKEEFDRVEFLWPRHPMHGKGNEEIYFKQELYPAKISSIKLVMANVKDHLYEKYGHMVTLSLRYGWMEITHVPGFLWSKIEWYGQAMEELVFENEGERRCFEADLKKPAVTDDPNLHTSNKPTGRAAISVYSPGWEHTVPEFVNERQASEGDTIRLLADVDGARNGESISFEIYYYKGNESSIQFATANGKISNGVGSAEWCVDLEKPKKREAEVKIKFEPVVKGKYGNKCDIPLIGCRKLICDYVEISDVLFHSESAVPFLDRDGALITTLLTVYKFAQDHSGREVVLFGHTDVTGCEEYNWDLSKDRSVAIKALLDRDSETWKNLTMYRSKIEDYQYSLKTLGLQYGWPCDPGDVDGINGPKTENGLKNFQKEYNSRLSKSITEDGKIGPQTWVALFEVMVTIVINEGKHLLESDELPSLEYGYGNCGIYPCGESFPIEGIPGSDPRNRRVEVVFFEKSKAPELTDHPRKSEKVTKDENPVYDEQRVERRAVEAIEFRRQQLFLLEFVHPIIHTNRPHKQYVNLDSNGREEGTALTIKVRPKSPAQEVSDGVVYWKITAHEDNSARTEPKTGIKRYWEHADLQEFNQRIITCTTDFIDREATIILECGVAGGDKFSVEVGSDGVNYPLKLEVENWRRIWYQYTHEQNMILPPLTQFHDAYKRVFVEPQISTTVLYSKDQTPDRTYYPEWMLRANNSNREISVIGDHNKQHFYDMFRLNPSKKPNAHLIVCQSAWDIGSVSSEISFSMIQKSKIFNVYKESDGNEQLNVFKPALTGNLVVSGEWVQPLTRRKGNITDDNITIPRNRTSLNVVEVSLSEDAPTPTRDNPVNVTLTLRGADGPYLGECNGSKLLAVYTEPVDFNNTIAHEIGHAFNQVPLPSRVPPGLEAHPRQYTEHGGIGSHCNTVIEEGKQVAGSVANGIYRTGICVMFHAGDSSCINRFCDICETYLKAANCSDFRRR
ncbi:hypothetical protein CHISP_3403 [Chitinispirillum alkaliphilum]|nr:hypothetical protein CHISP_3403 [Chitinispirillum alkaliphilum]